VAKLYDSCAGCHAKVRGARKGADYYPPLADDEMESKILYYQRGNQQSSGYAPFHDMMNDQQMAVTRIVAHSDPQCFYRYGLPLLMSHNFEVSNQDQTW
jgi:cytochrome c553